MRNGLVAMKEALTLLSSAALHSYTVQLLAAIDAMLYRSGGDKKFIRYKIHLSTAYM
jgi:hypothetical protein